MMQDFIVAWVNNVGTVLIWVATNDGSGHLIQNL